MDTMFISREKLAVRSATLPLPQTQGGCVFKINSITITTGSSTEADAQRDDRLLANERSANGALTST